MASSSPPAAVDPSRKWIIAATTTLGTFMEVLDTSVANVALPHMRGTYASGVDEITWVITSYLVANAVILPITGWLGSYFGRRRFYLTCLAIFTVSSLGAGAAPSLPFLVLMRVIQGLAGGAMVPMSQAILLETFPKEEHGKAMAVFGVGVIFGPIIGPTLGGFITDTWDWRWIFYINVPVGILALVLWRPIHRGSPLDEAPRGADRLRQLRLHRPRARLPRGLPEPRRALRLVRKPDHRRLRGPALVGLALFVWRCFTAENPLVDLRVFRNREFPSGTTLMFLLGFGLYGSFIMLPLFVQSSSATPPPGRASSSPPAASRRSWPWPSSETSSGRSTPGCSSSSASGERPLARSLQSINLDVDFRYVMIPG